MRTLLVAVVMALVGALMSPMSPARADEIRSEVEERQATASTAVQERSLEALRTMAAARTEQSAETSEPADAAGYLPVDSAAMGPAGGADSSVQVRITDPKKMGFLEMPCELQGQLCPSESQLVVRMDEDITFKGTVDASMLAGGAKVAIQRAPISLDGEVGEWETVARAKVNQRGKFAVKAVAPVGMHVFRWKYIAKSSVRQARSAMVGASQIVNGMPLLYMNIVNIMDSLSKNNINVYVTTNVNTANGCGTSTSDSCPTASTSAIPLNGGGDKAQPGDEGSSVKLIYILPVAEDGSPASESLPFSLWVEKQKCVGKCSKYIPDWSAGLGGKSCSKVDPAPASYMTPGSEWTVYIKQQITGYNALLANPNMPKAKKDRWAKHSAKNGCVFAIQTKFDNAIANLGVGEWIMIILGSVLLAAAAVIGLFIAAEGIIAVAVVAGVVALVAGVGLIIGGVAISYNDVADKPAFVDVKACANLGEQVGEAAKGSSSFAGMIIQPGGDRTTMYFRNAACTVPDDMPNTIRTVTSARMG